MVCCGDIEVEKGKEYYKNLRITTKTADKIRTL